MTLASITTKPPRTTDTGTGAKTAFDFAFKIFTSTDIDVYVDGVLQTLTSDYTVSFDTANEEGTVTFLSAPADDAEVLIIRNIPYSQPTDVPIGEGWTESSQEKALDWLGAQIQQAVEAIGRSLKLPVTSSVTDIALPEPEAAKALKWNALGTALVNTTYDPDDAADEAAASALAAASSASAAATAETNAETAETNAEAWATKTDGQVLATDYSAKAYAIGGAGVTDGDGAAKEWATKAEDSTVDGTEYSAKHYAAKASASAASFDFASQAEAEAGTNETKNMNPLRTSQAIAALAELSSADIIGQTEAVIAAGDSIVFSDVDDAGSLKRDTVQGVLDLVSSSISAKEVFTSYDASTTGALTITGVGFQPKLILVSAALDAAVSRSFGSAVDPQGSCTIVTNTNIVIHSSIFEPTTYRVSSVYHSTGNVAYTEVTSLDNDGVTLAKGKAGTPTGTVDLLITFIA